MSEPKPCPMCGQRVSVSSSDGGTSSYIGLDAAELAELKAMDRPEHIVIFDEETWTLQHPLSCRLGGLFECPYTEAIGRHTSSAGRPVPVGTYEVQIHESGPPTYVDATYPGAGEA